MTCLAHISCLLILSTSWVSPISATKMVKVASFEDLLEATKNDNVLIIDVREPQELKDTGVVPNSINIPLAQVKDVLSKTSAEEFKETYGKEKPGFDTPIIFTCRSGRRSEQAYLIAEELGFKDLKNFGGGWLLWESRIKEIKA